MSFLNIKLIIEKLTLIKFAKNKKKSVKVLGVKSLIEKSLKTT